METLKMIDLFAGGGGLSLGFEQMGFDVVLANEYDKSIAQAYIKNRKNPNMIIEDITKLPIHDTFKQFKGTVDLCVGGPPCQGYSQKGQRKTINDPRNFLFKYFVEVVKEVSPRYFVMENVPNLLTAENGYFQNELTTMFTELGYIINAQVLCAADYGVPQSRHRAVIIGKKAGSSPVAMPKTSKIKTTIWDAISDLNYLNSGEGTEISEYRCTPESDYQELLRKGSTALFNHIATNHKQFVKDTIALVPEGGNYKDLPEGVGNSRNFHMAWTRLDGNAPARTVDTGHRNLFHYELNRVPTVRESARIQSFPDNFVFKGSRTKQERQVGNAVPPLLGQALAEELLKIIERNKTNA